MMSPSDLEFLAEKEMVEIIPKFTLDSLYLIEGNLGPFRAGLPVRVPLWVALDLRRRERCTLVPPSWMNIQCLDAVKKEERDNPMFTKMPSENYMAISNLIYKNCSQDIPDADKVQILIKDIWDNRISKLRTAILGFIEQGASFARVDNLTQMEMATVRPFFPHALEQIHRLRTSARAAMDMSSNTQSFLSNSMSMNNSDSMNINESQ